MDAGEGEVSGAASVGLRLGRAREAAGLSVADLAAKTRIPIRHLQAIEAGDFTALPGRSYAVGFARTYARAVGEDGGVIAAAVAADYAAAMPQDDALSTPAFTPGDPARVPSSRFAWAAAAALAVVAAGGFAWWQSNHAASETLPSLLPAETPVAQVVVPLPAPSELASTAPAIEPDTTVVLTAQVDKLWLKIADGEGRQVVQKQLALGESYTIPAEVAGAKIWTGRPDKLDITVGGQSVPKLADEQKAVKDMPVSAAALLGRAHQAVAAPVAVPSAGVATPAPAAVASPKPAVRHRARPPRGDSEAAVAQRAFNAQPAAVANPSTATQ